MVWGLAGLQVQGAGGGQGYRVSSLGGGGILNQSLRPECTAETGFLSPTLEPSGSADCDLETSRSSSGPYGDLCQSR